MTIALYLHERKIPFKSVVCYQFKVGQFEIQCELRADGTCIGAFMEPGCPIEQADVKMFRSHEMFVDFIKTLED
jgi:hypothetical protein